MAGTADKMSPGVRSLFAIIDGLLLFLAVDGVFYAIAFLGLKRSFDTPTIPYLSSNLVWTIGAALLAGYTAGRVAHRSPVLHGIILAVPFVLLAGFNLHKGIGNQRAWFVIAYNILVPLSFVLGAYLVAQRRSRRSAEQSRRLS